MIALSAVQSSTQTLFTLQDLHSSRMHTARSLTVSPNMQCSGGWVPGPVGGGRCPVPGGCLLPRVCVCSRGCVSALGGVYSRGCVSARGGVYSRGCVSARGGVSAPGGRWCNGCKFYDRENTSTHFTVICVCNILMGNLLL